MARKLMHHYPFGQSQQLQKKLVGGSVPFSMPMQRGYTGQNDHQRQEHYFGLHIIPLLMVLPFSHDESSQSTQARLPVRTCFSMAFGCVRAQVRL
jgi:hypothetical protein